MLLQTKPASRRLLAALILAPAALVACGGDDGGSGSTPTSAVSATTTAATSAPAAETTAAPAPSTCLPLDVTFTDKETGAEFAATSALAVSLAGGSAYTVYLADFEIDPAEVGSFSNPTVPAGGSMATLAITVFNATETPPPVSVGRRSRTRPTSASSRSSWPARSATRASTRAAAPAARWP